jgi:hypothetical protein
LRYFPLYLIYLWESEAGRSPLAPTQSGVDEKSLELHGDSTTGKIQNVLGRSWPGRSERDASRSEASDEAASEVESGHCVSSAKSRERPAPLEERNPPAKGAAENSSSLAE